MKTVFRAMVVSGLMGIVGLPGISQAGDYTDAVKNMMELMQLSMFKFHLKKHLSIVRMRLLLILVIIFGFGKVVHVM